jgi:hypothetical protein
MSTLSEVCSWKHESRSDRAPFRHLSCSHSFVIRHYLVDLKLYKEKDLLLELSQQVVQFLARMTPAG